MRHRFRHAGAATAAIALLAAFQAPAKPEAELAAVVNAYLSMGLPTDWAGIEKLPGFEWAALPPTALRNCLPNGDCFARQGRAVIGGKRLAVVASGARSMVVTLLLRNGSAPFGNAAVVKALERAGLGARLARCPVARTAGGTSWYRLQGDGVSSGFLSIQAAGPGRPGEGFVLTLGDDLPALPPAQLARYSEQCGAGAERPPVSALKPHESLARIVVALLPPARGLYDWTALAGLATGIRWLGEGPRAADLSALGDPNPMMRSGEVTWAGRRFSVAATGTATTVKAIRLEEAGLHPKGEHMLGVVYELGIAVRLVRCGPVYTESTNNWYSLTSGRTGPAAIRQSIRYDGSQVQDSYELRLDGGLPVRDPRDRDPGTGGC